MSYCRFSDGNWGCDLYCYANVSGGYSTHVASRRRIFPPIPAIPLMRWPFVGRVIVDGHLVYARRRDWVMTYLYTKLWALSYSLNLWMVGIIPLRKIGLTCDGETYNDDLPGFKIRATELRAMGYRIPDACYQAIMAETEEN